MSTDPLLGEIAGPGSGPPLSAPGVTPPSLSGAGRRFLSDILVELGFVSEQQAEQAVAAARRPGQTPEKILLERKAITEEQLARALAERYGLDYIDLNEYPVDKSAAALLRQTAAKRYLAAPVGFADDGALVLAVADPADSLGLSDIAVMTKLPVRPAVAARTQITKLLDTMTFMEEPVQGGGQSVSTVIVPPDDGGTAAEPQTPPEAQPQAADESAGRELDSAVEREHQEALASLRLEKERALASAESAAEEALRAERASAQQALGSLRAKHEEELAAERAKRVEEVEVERGRTAAAIDAERERNAKELEALRARLTEELEAARAEAANARSETEAARQGANAPAGDSTRVEQLEAELAAAREQIEITADADRRAEAARAALAALRDESERQAQVHALTERELRAELEQVRAELDSIRSDLPQAR
jgi:Type II secretion system (T2SS), protein E, N-terminal domain